MVKARVQVQLKLDNKEVGKLLYRARVLFQIVEDLRSDSYHVKRNNDANYTVRKCKGTDLYLLPPAIFPSDPLDTMNARYLNYSNTPVISPLKKALKIEMYNDTYFNKQPTSQFVSKNFVSCQLDDLALQSRATPKLHSVTYIFKEFETEMTNVPTIEVISHDNNGCKNTDIVPSQSNLFFIKYTPDNTQRQCWYLVQIDLEAPLELNKDYPIRDSYHYVLLAKHPNDASKSDEFRICWLEWHMYTRCSTTNEIVYDDQILIWPSHYPNKERFIQLYYNLPLLDSSLNSRSIIGPFDFDKIDMFNRTRQKFT